MIRDIVRELAKILPDVPVWLGGPEVSYNAEEILVKLPFLTGIMVGEGEETFRELLCYYRNGSTKETAGLEKIAGIVFRRHAGICRTGERRLTDISGLPFFYNEEDIGDFRNRIIIMNPAEAARTGAAIVSPPLIKRYVCAAGS